MRTLVAAAVASLILVGLSHAQDTKASIKQYQIAAQPLAEALRSFADQSSMQLIFSESEVAGARSEGVDGTLTALEALGQILKGTDLGFEFTENDVVVVRKTTGVKTTAGYPSTSASRVAQVEQSAEKSGMKPVGSPRDDVGAADQSRGDKENIQEIVVTAQKREERLQDVPISISVMSGESLDSSTLQGVSEALNAVPGVATTLSYQGGATTLMVRGVTAASGVFFGSSPIAYYIDSVPFGLIGSAIVPDTSAYDMDRVEVLRGPQGTLYGASAQNGVIRIITEDANPSEIELKARTSASSTEKGAGSYRGDLAFNLPIVKEKIAARAVVGYQDLGGWIDKPGDPDTNDGEVRNLRVKVGARPTEQFSVDLSAWLSRSDFGAPSQSADGYQSTVERPEPISSDFDSYGLKLDYDASAFSIASMTSYLEYQNDGMLDYFSLPLFTGLGSKVFTEEVNLSSKRDGLWRWTAGGMYRDNETSLFQTFGSFYPVPVTSVTKSESLALFGELTRIFSDGKLELTGGLRYFEDHITGITPLAYLGSDLVDTSDGRFDAVSPRGVLNWHPSRQMTVYASYSEGFRSGGPASELTLSAFPDTPDLEPDNLKNYELGMKGSLWDGRLSIDTALYYIDWQDVQMPLILVSPDGIPYAAMVNGESASGMGVDFGITASIVDRLTLGFNFGWNSLEMDADVLSQNTVLWEAGDRMNGSPEYLIGGSLEYALPFGGSGVEGRFRASANYTSEQDLRMYFGNLLATVGDTLLVARASFSLSLPSNWIATVFVDNATDERGTPLRDPEGFPEYSVRMRPRTIGFQVEYKY